MEEDSVSQFSQIKEATYWTEPHPTSKNYSNKPLPQKTDVLVVGSGYTGVVTALQLKKAGVDVTLIDKGRIGSEASSKNGGMCLSGLSTALFKVKQKFGRDKMVRFFQEALESINCVERLVTEGKIDCHFRRNGFLEAAFKPSHYEGLKEEQEFLAENLDHTTFLIPPEKMREEIGSDLYHGGLVEPVSAGLHPAKYIAGLIRRSCLPLIFNLGCGNGGGGGGGSKGKKVSELNFSLKGDKTFSELTTGDAETICMEIDEWLSQNIDQAATCKMSSVLMAAMFGGNAESCEAMYQACLESPTDEEVADCTVGPEDLVDCNVTVDEYEQCVEDSIQAQNNMMAQMSCSNLTANVEEPVVASCAVIEQNCPGLLE